MQGEGLGLAGISLADCESGEDTVLDETATADDDLTIVDRDRREDRAAEGAPEGSGIAGERPA